MKALASLMLCGSVLALAACGPNPATRAVTGATTGAVVAGPVGAAAGGLAGATGAVRVNP